MERYKIGNVWRTIGIIFAMTSLVPLGLGFHKLFAKRMDDLFDCDVQFFFVAHTSIFLQQNKRGQNQSGWILCRMGRVHV